MLDMTSMGIIIEMAFTMSYSDKWHPSWLTLFPQSDTAKA